MSGTNTINHGTLDFLRILAAYVTQKSRKCQELGLGKNVVLQKVIVFCIDLRIYYPLSQLSNDLLKFLKKA